MLREGPPPVAENERELSMQPKRVQGFRGSELKALGLGCKDAHLKPKKREEKAQVEPHGSLALALTAPWASTPG